MVWSPNDLSTLRGWLRAKDQSYANLADCFDPVQSSTAMAPYLFNDAGSPGAVFHTSGGPASGPYFALPTLRASFLAEFDRPTFEDEPTYGSVPGYVDMNSGTIFAVIRANAISTVGRTDASIIDAPGSGMVFASLCDVITIGQYINDALQPVVYVRFEDADESSIGGHVLSHPVSVGDWVIVIARYGGTTLQVRFITTGGVTDYSTTYGTPAVPTVSTGCFGYVLFPFGANNGVLSPTVIDDGDSVESGTFVSTLSVCDLGFLTEYLCREHGFTAVVSPGAYSDLMVWLDAAYNAGSVDGDIVLTWSEAGAIDNSHPNGFIDTPGDGAVWNTNVLCGTLPVLRFNNDHRGFKDTTRDTPSAASSDHWIFSESGFTVIALGRVVSNDADFASGGVNFHIFSSRALDFQIEGDTDFGYFVQFDAASSVDGASYSTTYPALGDWIFVVITWDGTTLITKINGVLIDSRLFSGPLEQFGTSYLEIGLGSPGTLDGPLAGNQVAEHVGVAVYDRCLTNVELASLVGYYQCRYPCLSFTPTTPGNIRLRATQFTRIGAGVGM